MSNVVVPSFFPTSIEIAGGIRWVKEHPVVATAAVAAATAVSVLKYLQVATEDDTALKVAILSPRKETDDVCSTTESDASTPSRDRTLTLRNLSFLESERDIEIDAAVGDNVLLEPALLEEDGETGSPQWGWYVSTTPPEDYYP
ncbi:hypothetical protein KXD40_006275 [Peronospora effusa]|uniref:Uncharacterized protein n=1 Tax=Peronospora effusa TaxID=542832 RepID=A0A3M6VVY2_9STRA|nr:hypothetical protein DD238_001002 [Peronospora effusa]UIZ25739.1 hypothetical protein KXD40_006275 [Peronospora effusa]